VGSWRLGPHPREVERDHGAEELCEVPVYVEWGRDGDGRGGVWAWVEADVCPGCGCPLDKAEQAECERLACDPVYDAGRD